MAALYDELCQVDKMMAERLRALVAGQAVNRLDFTPPDDFLTRLKQASQINSPAGAEARSYAEYVAELYQILRLARLIAG